MTGNSEAEKPVEKTAKQLEKEVPINLLETSLSSKLGAEIMLMLDQHFSSGLGRAHTPLLPVIRLQLSNSNLIQSRVFGRCGGSIAGLIPWLTSGLSSCCSYQHSTFHQQMRLQLVWENYH